MSVTPTADGLKQTRKPYIKWDKIKIDIGDNKVFFMRKDVVVGFLKTGTTIRESDTITLTDMSGKIEVTMS